MLGRVQTLDCDVLVIGGGSSGVCATYASASVKGARTILVDAHAKLGGIATHALVGTICGLHDCSDDADDRRLAVHGFAHDLAQQVAAESQYEMETHGPLKFLPYDVGRLGLIYQDLCKDARVLSGATAMTTEVINHNIATVNVDYQGQIIEIHPASVIDCTGESAISALSGLRLSDNQTQAGAFTLLMQPAGTEPIRAQFLNILKGVYNAVDRGNLPHPCRALSMVPQSNPNRPVILKIPFPEPIDLSPAGRIRQRDLALGWAQQLGQFIEHHYDWALVTLGHDLGRRAGPLPYARYILCESDVMNAAKFTDGIAVGLWPIEIWPVGRPVQLRFLPMGDYYHIPARSLQDNLITNLWFAGRALGAEANAIASARVIGTCWQTGYAAGSLASAQALQRDLMKEVTELNYAQGRHA